jgi:hypothetical protein
MEDQIELLTAECARLENERDEALIEADKFREFCADYRKEVARLKVCMNNLRVQRDEARTALGLPITTRNYK